VERLVLSLMELLELVGLFLVVFGIIIGTPLVLAWLIHWGLSL